MDFPVNFPTLIITFCLFESLDNSLILIIIKCLCPIQRGSRKLIGSVREIRSGWKKNLKVFGSVMRNKLQILNFNVFYSIVVLGLQKWIPEPFSGDLWALFRGSLSPIQGMLLIGTLCLLAVAWWQSHAPCLNKILITLHCPLSTATYKCIALVANRALKSAPASNSSFKMSSWPKTAAIWSRPWRGSLKWGVLSGLWGGSGSYQDFTVLWL